MSHNTLSVKLEKLEQNHPISREFFPSILTTVEFDFIEHANGIKLIINELEKFSLFDKGI
ncbi:hypothetical protein ACFQ3R_00370 [Mesonia ostreae]|uniref:hypothetical protein n=1 Tax=Mesonia ostreae TaxID=861110 RepID=UPI003645BC2B